MSKKVKRYIQQGNILREQGKLEEALKSYNEAIILDPDSAEAFNFSGVTLFTKGMVSEALRSYNRALDLRHDYPEALSNKANALMVSGLPEQAIDCYRASLGMNPNLNLVRSNLLLSLNYLPEFTQEQIYRESSVWELYCPDSNRNSTPVTSYDHNRSRKIRIGYISPDFREHSVNYFFEPLLRNHDRSRFEVYCYSDAAFPDDTTRRLEKISDEWRNISGVPDDAVYDVIQKDGIQILVELAGHTGKNRLYLCSKKPAPLQVSWLGYPNTTGLSTMDYRLSDNVADPEGNDDRYYSEQIIRLKKGFLCYAPPADAPLLADRPYKRNGYITFGSFNNIAKISPFLIETWSRILHNVEGAVLVLKNRFFADNEVRDRFYNLFAIHGIDQNRIRLMLAESSTRKHLEKYSHIDIALDTFPYNGATTTCEALWMGVPVVTLRGNRHAGRVGASILHRLGMDSLIAETVENYISISEVLSKDQKLQNKICHDIRGRMLKSPLCDAYKFTKSVENEYIRIWHNWDRSAKI